MLFLVIINLKINWLFIPPAWQSWKRQDLPRESHAEGTTYFVGIPVGQEIQEVTMEERHSDIDLQPPLICYHPVELYIRMLWDADQVKM